MAGDPGLTAAQWQALYLRLERPLYNLAWRYVWNEVEAQDVVHDAFLDVWDRRGSLRAETTDRYLWVAVLNRARKRRRWWRLRTLLDPQDEVVAGLADPTRTETLVEHDETQRALHCAIRSLPEKLRSVLLLSEFSELGYEDIARILHVPAGTVASRRHLAIRRLRALLVAGGSHEP